jgi:ABC-2 type transport system ATP-binding protein
MVTAPATTTTSDPEPPDRAATTENVLSLANVSKRFHGDEALHGACLAVPQGSVVGLLGANGAGKTTLIRCALGLARPDSGTATVFGEPAWSLSADAKSRIGYVPQDPALHAWMRARDLLRYVSAFYPKWDAPLVARLASEWHVDPAARVGTMSPGTRQRLAIILALAHRPDLLILDEPAAHLDPAGRREFLKAVLAVAAGGDRTVLFSTHITSDLERVADRVAVLRNGSTLYDGPLDTLKDSIKRIHLSAAAPLSEPLIAPGLLRVERAGNDATVSVRNFSPALVDDLARRYGAEVSVEDLNLEEIFLEVQHGYGAL